MNRVLQKWARGKVKTLKRWAEEYDKLCKEEGIKENNIISFALDRDYVGSIHAVTKEDILIETKALFRHNGEWS